MANKMKMVEKFDAIKAMLNGESVEGFSKEDALKFLDDRIEKVNAQNAHGGERKPTKTQLENENIKEQILSCLAIADKPMSATEVGNELGYSCSKASALLTQLVKSEHVVRTEVKGKAFFALANKE